MAYPRARMYKLTHTRVYSIIDSTDGLNLLSADLCASEFYANAIIGAAIRVHYCCLGDMVD